MDPELEEKLDLLHADLVDIETILGEMRDMMKAQKEMGEKIAASRAPMVNDLMGMIPEGMRKQIEPLLATMGGKHGQ